MEVVSKALKKEIFASAHAKILGYIATFTMNITFENLDSTRKVSVSAYLIILHGSYRIHEVTVTHRKRQERNYTQSVQTHVGQ